MHGFSFETFERCTSGSFLVVHPNHACLDRDIRTLSLFQQPPALQTAFLFSLVGLPQVSTDPPPTLRSWTVLHACCPSLSHRSCSCKWHVCATSTCDGSWIESKVRLSQSGSSDSGGEIPTEPKVDPVKTHVHSRSKRKHMPFRKGRVRPETCLPYRAEDP